MRLLIIFTFFVSIVSCFMTTTKENGKENIYAKIILPLRSFTFCVYLLYDGFFTNCR